MQHTTMAEMGFHSLLSRLRYIKATPFSRSMFVDVFRHAARRRRPGKLLVERHAAAHRDGLARHVGVVDQHHFPVGNLIRLVR
jgi:hypothetical protein